MSKITADDFTFLIEMNQKEIEIRGKYMLVASELELILSFILTACLIDSPQNYNDFRSIVLEKATLGKKIELCKRFLPRFNKDLFNKYKSLFDSTEAKTFAEYRNLLAHTTIKYKDLDRTQIVFDKMKEGKYTDKPISYEELLITLSNQEAKYPKFRQLLSEIGKMKGDKKIL